MTTPAPSNPDPADLKAGRPALYDARHQHLREMMAYFGIPALLIVDPINIFYATGARNMMFFSMRVPARYLLIPPQARFKPLSTTFETRLGQNPSRQRSSLN